MLVGLGGYAIGYDIFEGNTYEGHTLVPFLEKISKKLDGCINFINSLCNDMCKSLLILLLLSVLLGCSLEVDNPEYIIVNSFQDPLKNLPDLGPVRFDEPSPGQRSYYIRFKAINEGSIEDVKVNLEYDYTDTLVFAITEGIYTGPWTIIEFYTEGSQIHSRYSDFIEAKTVKYLELSPDSIYLKEPEDFVFSNLIGFFDLILQAAQVKDSLSSDALPYFGYSTNIWYQYAIDLNQFEQVYDSLNMYFDYTDMWGDGLGLTYVYGPQYGIVRMGWVSAWDIDEAKGWIMISK